MKLVNLTGTLEATLALLRGQLTFDAATGQLQRVEPYPGTNYYGIGSIANPASLGIGVGAGPARFDGAGALTAGNLYYMNAGTWTPTNATNNTAGYQSELAIALGASAAQGMLQEGWYRPVAGYILGVAVEGAPIFMHTVNGRLSYTQPVAAGNVTRVIGYGGPGGTMRVQISGAWAIAGP